MSPSPLVKDKVYRYRVIAEDGSNNRSEGTVEMVSRLDAVHFIRYEIQTPFYLSLPGDRKQYLSCTHWNGQELPHNVRYRVQYSGSIESFTLKLSNGYTRTLEAPASGGELNFAIEGLAGGDPVGELEERHIVQYNDAGTGLSSIRTTLLAKPLGADPVILFENSSYWQVSDCTDTST
ncbi:hypothetical protein HNR42_002658 [Deinobacterium chartae]|uniref:Uncharacterized protein n=1 Tax=Deinobacterium chartae TaxID=521158 RepID=A0A841I481_9DEIO|nr:hypothetical protein [Deinobacterium chartae]MBB6099220.1 hypothetical protein [Deinobacterium chartae]